MGLEVATFIGQLVATNPVGGTDQKAQGDDHLRLIKSVLQNTFPGLNQAITFGGYQAKNRGFVDAGAANRTQIASDDGRLVLFNTTAAARTYNLLAAATAGAGFFCWIMGTGTNGITLDPSGAELIEDDGTDGSTLVLGANEAGWLFCDGAKWRFLRALRRSASYTFTKPQSITSVASGGVLNLTSTDAGTFTGPDIVALRDSATPAANDFLSSWEIRGRNSAAAAMVYCHIFGQIKDHTSGSEDSLLGLRTLRAGAASDWLLESGTIRHQSQSLPSNAGGIAAVDVLVGGVSIASTVIQTVAATPYTTFTIVTAAADAIPFDDTIPQQTEGFELFNIPFTPRSAASTIHIRVSGMCAGNTGAVICTAALFKDAAANALFARGAATGDNELVFPLGFDYSEPSGSTALRNYKVRVGPNSGNMYVNGYTGALRRYGGASAWTFVIEERL